MIKVYRNIAEIEQISSKNAVHHSAIMGLDEVRISVVTDRVIDIEEGDYIIHNDIRYVLNRDAEYEIRGDVNYSYDLIFEHPQYRLIDKLLANGLTGQTSFTLTGKLADFVNLLVSCVNVATNPHGVDDGWITGDIIDTEYKNLTIEDLNCREALKFFAKEFDVEYYFSGDGKTINFAERFERTTSLVFEQGKGLGLYKIQQQNIDKEDTVTRVYVRGGNKNVPIAYADEEGYLKLPENYLENFTEHSKVVERKMKFEEEFPHFLGSVSTVSGENNSILTCPAIDFDVSAIAVGDTARINFLTGDMMGNSFEFSWDNSLKQITLIDKEDETALPDADGVKPTIPSLAKKAKVGDTFNFTGVMMPVSYVNTSITRLRAKGNKWLDFYSKKRVKFSLDIDHRWMRDKNNLKVGDLVVISIPQRSFSQVIRITQLESNLNTGAISATVSNYLQDSWERYDEYQTNLKQREILGFQTNITIVNGVMYRDRGLWSAETAVVKPYLRTSQQVDDVWHIGCKWRCQVNKTTTPPSFTTDHWLFLEGRSDIRMEFDSSNGFSFFAGNVNTVITPIVFIGNANVSTEIPDNQWQWRRESGDIVSDNVWNTQRGVGRVLELTNEDVGTMWSKTNPVRFICTALFPRTELTTITDYLEI